MKNQCNFCRPGRNLLGGVYHHGKDEVIIPTFVDNWDKTYETGAGMQERKIGLELNLVNLTEDKSYADDDSPLIRTPYVEASFVTCSGDSSLAVEDVLDPVSVPIRFCPVCGRRLILS